jgi:hypothetical protein
MTESAGTAPRNGSNSLFKTMARKALAPVISSVIHAASAYLGQKAGELAKEKLLPLLQERLAGEQRADNGRSSGDDERRNREERRSRRREALERSGTS